MGATSIEWTDAVWNPVTGCRRVSRGCGGPDGGGCYAEATANRFWATQYPPNDDGSPRRFTDVRCHPERLGQPLRWRRPRRVFVNSMSDLFHEDVPDDFIAAVFGVMAAAPQHTFQILTKRPERGWAWFAWHRGTRRGRDLDALDAWRVCEDAALELVPDLPAIGMQAPWPLPNVWLGVSVEDQAAADARIPLLLDTPAAVRFVSYEPALAAVDFRRLHARGVLIDALGGDVTHIPSGDVYTCTPSVLDWLIIGGESGPKARPFDLAWARSVIGQCRDAGVACFCKQLGRRPVSERPTDWSANGRFDGVREGRMHLRDSHGGDPAEWPNELRVREFPRELPRA